MSSSFRSGSYPLSGLNAAIYAMLLLLLFLFFFSFFFFCANVYCFFGGCSVDILVLNIVNMVGIVSIVSIVSK